MFIQTSSRLRLGHSRRVSFAIDSTTETVCSRPPSRAPSPNPENVRTGTLLRQTTNNENPSDDCYTVAETRLLHDFCLSVKESRSVRQCLGVLKDDPADKYHRIWSMPVGGCFDLADKVQLSSWISDPISLRTLLASPGPNKPPRKDRLCLGVKLASSVIQLHKTKWLNEPWGKGDIVFFTDPRTNNPLTEQPVVVHNLGSCASDATQLDGIVFRKSKVLFSLGVVLWELWFWKRFEDLNADANLGSELDYVHWPDNIKVLGTAAAALEMLVDDAPKLYSDAVRTCLFGNIPTDDKEFTGIVWEKIFCPLNENFEFSAYGGRQPR